MINGTPPPYPDHIVFDEVAERYYAELEAYIRSGAVQRSTALDDLGATLRTAATEIARIIHAQDANEGMYAIESRTNRGRVLLTVKVELFDGQAGGGAHAE